MPWIRSLLVPLLVLVATLLSAVYCNIVPTSLGQENSATQRYRPRPAPLSTAGPIELLRLDWNSEAAADWPAADILATISKLSYLPPVEAERKYRSLGFQRIRPFSVNTLNGYVVSADDVAVIVFQGTDDISEWIVNLSAVSYYTPEGSIHDGYYKAYRSLKPQITKLLQESRPRKIWITGHSLGGALGLICAYDLITHDRVLPYGLMTFGQPMVVDKYLAGHLDKSLLGRYVHFVNEHDIVPRVPPGFAHCGSLVWFTGGKIQRSKPKHTLSTTEFENPQNRHDLIAPLSEEEFADLKAKLAAPQEATNSTVKNTAFSSETPIWIRDHAMTLYLKKVQTVSERRESP